MEVRWLDGSGSSMGVERLGVVGAVAAVGRHGVDGFRIWKLGR